ncbi:MAG: thiamine ABC transporter ATP-binding protein [Rhodobacteraceae bacterium]|nr:MAG: thiamine ABC transporter ATP-binding protein [Paracoccaceae bacterium]|tara:strand:- start:409 stop:1095 length:687 start_codon:yes stop_codon:yes gene_type:complete
MLDASFTAKIDGFTLSAKFVLETSGVIAVIGPSGAGKSSLLNVLAGYSKTNQGHILWNGNPIHTQHPSLRPIAILFQDNNLFPHLTIQKNLALALTQWPWLSLQQKILIRDTLASTGLSYVEDRLPSKLSGGQQSRAALARVLLQKKPILVLDEPFSALGPGLKDEMLDLLDYVTKKNNLFTLLVTHDPKDALRIAPRTITVINGEVSGPICTKIALNKESGPLTKYL